MKTILVYLTIFVSSNSFGQQIKTDSTKTNEIKNELKTEDFVLKCGGNCETLFYSKQDKAFEKK